MRTLTALTALLALNTASAATLTLWEGHQVLETWLGPGVTVEAEKMAGVAPGSRISVNFSVGDSADFGQIDLAFPDGNAALETTDTSTGCDEFGVYRPGTSTTSFTVAEADAAEFARQGLWLKAQNITLFRITLVNPGDDTSDTDPDTDPGKPSDDNDPDKPSDDNDPDKPSDDTQDALPATAPDSADAAPAVRYFGLDGRPLREPRRGQPAIVVRGADARLTLY